jgi:hypothetical protein
MLDKPVRKMPGLLLQTAGRSLLQKRTSSEDASQPSGLSFGLASSKISFGLYEGRLPVDSCYKSSSCDSESDSDRNETARRDLDSVSSNDSGHGSGPATAVSGLSAKRVFSNWGGEFFKKNLDYRANTNKILEKMTLNSLVAAHPAPSKASNGDSASGERFKASIIGGSLASAASKRSSEDGVRSSESPMSKKFNSSFFNSYA